MTGYPLHGIRVRLAGAFTLGFAVLLALGGLALWWRLGEEYRQDFDRELRNTAVSAVALFRHDEPEFHSTVATAEHLLTELVFTDRLIVAVDSQYRRFASTLPYAGAPLLDDLNPRLRAPEPATVELSAGHVRVLEVQLKEGVRLLIAMPLAPLEVRLRALGVTLAVGLPLILLVGAGVGVMASRSALRPVIALADAAERTGAAVERGDAGLPPLPVPAAPDELGRLTQALERLVARGQRAVQREREVAEQQRAFLADAAHELRTPLAIIRSEAEASLAAGGDREALRSALASVAAEAATLGSLVGDLLALAREASPASHAERERLFLDDLAHRAVARVRALPAAAGRTITFGEFAEAPVVANRALLERAILGLVHNALVHAAPSPVELSTGTEGAAAWIRVRDWGPGIPEGAEARVFERFERLDPARPGSGLGLAIARQIAAVHDGALVLERPADGGAAFVLRLPAAEDGAPAAAPAR